MLDYAKAIKIDRNNLDKEWLNIASQIFAISEESAETKEVLMKAEEKVKTVRSQLLLQLAQTPSLIDGKPTEANKEAWYREHPMHKKAKEEYIEADFQNNIVTGAVFAFQAKKNALEAMVKLYGMAYFTDMDYDTTDEARENTQNNRRNKTKKRRDGDGPS